MDLMGACYTLDEKMENGKEDRWREFVVRWLRRNTAARVVPPREFT